MNYYPYYINVPFNNFTPVAHGGLKSLLGGIKWSSILNGTQKTLGIVNQAIPIIKQAKPVINNAKTMFRIMNEFKKVDNKVQVNNNVINKPEINNNENSSKANVKQDGPIFFQ